MSEIEAKRLMFKIFNAIKYLHDKSIVHRDLKLENFLFETNEKFAEIKLIDFGLATTFD